MPSAEEARKKEIIRRWFEDVWNHRHADLIAELRAPDAVASGLAEGQATFAEIRCSSAPLGCSRAAAVMQG